MNIIVRLSDQIFVVAAVECDNRIVTGEPVFDDQCGYGRCGIFCEKHIMPHTQADYDIEIRFLLVQYFSLQDRIA